MCFKWLLKIFRHEKALEGITVCGEIRGRDRFIPVIMGLGMRDNQPMQVACIQLVNAIVSTPDDLDFRLHLRNEFMRTGLIDLIGVSSCDELNHMSLKLFTMLIHMFGGWFSLTYMYVVNLHVSSHLKVRWMKNYRHIFRSSVTIRRRILRSFLIAMTTPGWSLSILYQTYYIVHEDKC